MKQDLVPETVSAGYAPAIAVNKTVNESDHYPTGQFHETGTLLPFRRRHLNANEDDHGQAAYAPIALRYGRPGAQPQKRINPRNQTQDDGVRARISTKPFAFASRFSTAVHQAPDAGGN